MTFLYFAYGSNMLQARLRARCPSARLIDRATAIGFDFEFSKRSIDGSGKATLIPTRGVLCPGVIFEISRSEIDQLDRAEGAGAGYERYDDFVAEFAGTGEQVAVLTYLANAPDHRLKPFDWYLALVIAGALKNGLCDEHVVRLRLVEYLVDNQLDRRNRVEAVNALTDEGFADYAGLLMP